MIVMDTHVWIWWVSDPAQLSNDAMRLIDGAVKRDELHVSAISSWEAAMLVKHGRLTLSLPFPEWLRRVEAVQGLQFVPVDNRVAVRSVLLPEPFHKDPADRIIVATALELGATLVTRDGGIRRYPHVKTAW